MLKHIPNTITSLNLLCGCIGLVAVFQGELIWVPILIWLAALLDFFDGFAARMLKVSSPIGAELDSLADNVTFGLLPASLLYQMLAAHDLPVWVPYLAFVVSIFSAIRLAKFNVDTRQTTSFIGVPTPANALLISSFPLILQEESWLPLDFIDTPAFLLATAFIMSYLLIAELPLFALKFKSFAWGPNKIKYIFLIASVLLLIFFKFVAIPLIIILYILLSLITRPTP